MADYNVTEPNFGIVNSARPMPTPRPMPVVGAGIRPGFNPRPMPVVGAEGMNPMSSGAVNPGIRSRPRPMPVVGAGPRREGFMPAPAISAQPGRFHRATWNPIAPAQGLFNPQGMNPVNPQSGTAPPPMNPQTNAGMVNPVSARPMRFNPRPLPVFGPGVIGSSMNPGYQNPNG